MLQVNIEKIIPVTEARDMFNKIVDEVEGTDELYVLTKNGKPAAVVVGVNHLEKLTGDTSISMTASAANSSSDDNDDSSNDNNDNKEDDNNSFLSNNINQDKDGDVVFASADDVFTENNDGDQADLPTDPQPTEVARPNPMPTTENNHSLTDSQPALDAQNSTQIIKPIPDDFSDNIPTIPIVEDSNYNPDAANSNQGDLQIPESEDTNQAGDPNIDPFSSSSTIAEMNEEDVFGSQGDNQNNSDNSYPPQQTQHY